MTEKNFLGSVLLAVSAGVNKLTAIAARIASVRYFKEVRDSVGLRQS